MGQFAIEDGRMWSVERHQNSGPNTLVQFGDSLRMIHSVPQELLPLWSGVWLVPRNSATASCRAVLRESGFDAPAHFDPGNVGCSRAGAA